MTINKLLLFFANYHTGTYTTVIKATEKNGYKKISFCVCRFVNYYNIKENKMQNKTPSKIVNYERIIIPHILKENTNTNNILLSCYTTKNSRQKTKTKYYFNDVEITKQQYYDGIKEKEKKYNIDNLFNIKIDDILKIGSVTAWKQII